MLSMLQRRLHIRIMGVVRRGNVDHIHFRIIKNRLVGRKHLLYSVFLRKCNGLLIGTVRHAIKLPSHVCQGRRHLIGDDAGSQNRPV